MGRPAKPIELHVLDGNVRHLSHAEIAERTEAENEMRMGTQKLIASKRIKENPYAKKKFAELKRLYSGFKFVSSSDIGIIERYCITYAEYLELLDIKKQINDQNDDIVVAKLQSEQIGLDNKIIQKSNQLTKMEDRLCLNPLSKLKNVPAPKTKKKNKTEFEERFGNRL